MQVVHETRDVACYYFRRRHIRVQLTCESYPRVTLEAMVRPAFISTPVFGLSEQLVDETNALLYRR